MQLRQYQKDCIEALWQELFKEKTALCSLPTGSGKTICFIEFIKRAVAIKPNIKIVVLLNKVMLLDQTVKQFVSAFGESAVSTYCGSKDSYDTTKTITIASIQSIHDVPIDKLNLIIIDEVHGVNQDDGRYLSFINANSAAKIIAFTATPFRSTGYIYGKDKMFKRLTYYKSLGDMISQGYLVRPTMKKVEHQLSTKGLRVKMGEFNQSDMNKLVSDLPRIKLQITDALSRLDGRACVIWSCASIQHCEDVAHELMKQGETVAILHSKQTTTDRDWNTSHFESGELRSLVFVSIASEGWDHPPVDAIVIMRPIRSPVLYVQIVGRGLRTFRTKRDCLVLDYGSVVETLGPVDNPMVSRGGKAAKKAQPLPMKFCPECLSYVQVSFPICPDCGHHFKVEIAAANRLSTVSYSGDILSGAPKTVMIKCVRLSEYVSRNGNTCLKIQYVTDDLLGSPIDEYFSYSSEYSYKLLLKRLDKLGVSYAAPISEQVKQAVTNPPHALIYYMDEKRYPKISELLYG